MAVRSRRAEHAQDTRAGLLQAARELSAEKGYAAPGPRRSPAARRGGRVSGRVRATAGQLVGGRERPGDDRG